MPGRFTFNRLGSPPYFELVGADGVQRWSSNDKLLRFPNSLRGTISFGYRTTPIESTTVHTLGYCSALATMVHGYMRCTSIDLGVGQLSPFPAIGDWYYVSGTYLGFAGGGNSDSVCCYTFDVLGGEVRLTEQLAIYEIKNDAGQSFGFPAFTLEYDLELGTFA